MFLMTYWKYTLIKYFVSFTVNSRHFSKNSSKHIKLFEWIFTVGWFLSPFSPNLVPRVFFRTARGEGKTLVSAGHVSPRLWVINENDTMGRVGEERVCRVCNNFCNFVWWKLNLQQEIVKTTAIKN